MKGFKRSLSFFVFVIFVYPFKFEENVTGVSFGVKIEFFYKWAVQNGILIRSVS